MKKILLAVTAALAITSCSQNEEIEAFQFFYSAVSAASNADTDVGCRLVRL